MLNDKVDAFNPVVEHWDEAAQANEDYHKTNDDYCLFVITPEMSGIYSIFELADYSNKRPSKTICCFLKAYGGKEFDDSIWRGFRKIKLDLIHNGAVVCDDLSGVADFLNSAVN